MSAPPPRLSFEADPTVFPASGLVAVPAGAAAHGSGGALGKRLLREGLIAPHQLLSALALQSGGGRSLPDILVARRLMPEPVLFEAMTRHLGLSQIDPVTHPPDLRLLDRLGAATCLREGLLPWAEIGGTTIILTSAPETFARHRDMLTRLFGRLSIAVAAPSRIEAAVLALRGPTLAREAEARLPADISCRGYGAGGFTRILALAAAVLAVLVWAAPLMLAQAVALWATVTLVLSAGLKLAAGLATLRQPAPEGPAPIIARLPTVSVMVALYREGSIAPRLVQRLSRLDYPRDLLDILLVVEAEDHVTRDALAKANLPPWMRVVAVPDGPVRTKPRALNFALGQCRGSIVGVYDAEDAPEPDQIRRVVDRFHRRGEKVACLQGVLDFYNPRTNWLSRCFTMEYATWFRVILPGLQRLGLPLPLGGTTLFFRRAVLEKLGAWDAWNVTEDADLGMRLARQGYRTELIDTVTHEEACCRPLSWVKQRSRWLKGYMMTYITHMRDPLRLWRELGPRQFAGFQILFLATLSQFLLAPVLWSFWLAMLGLPHPVADSLSPGLFTGLIVTFVLAEAINIALGIIGLRRTRHRMNPLWVPTLTFYFPLGALASYKAALEMVTRPFYWDKTSHGHFDTHGGG